MIFFFEIPWIIIAFIVLGLIGFADMVISNIFIIFLIIVGIIIFIICSLKWPIKTLIGAVLIVIITVVAALISESISTTLRDENTVHIYVVTEESTLTLGVPGYTNKYRSEIVPAQSIVAIYNSTTNDERCYMEIRSDGVLTSCCPYGTMEYYEQTMSLSDSYIEMTYSEFKQLGDQWWDNTEIQGLQ